MTPFWANKLSNLGIFSKIPRKFLDLTVFRKSSGKPRRLCLPCLNGRTSPVTFEVDILVLHLNVRCLSMRYLAMIMETLRYVAVLKQHINYRFLHRCNASDDTNNPGTAHLHSQSTHPPSAYPSPPSSRSGLESDDVTGYVTADGGRRPSSSGLVSSAPLPPRTGHVVASETGDTSERMVCRGKRM